MRKLNHSSDIWQWEEEARQIKREMYSLSKIFKIISESAHEKPAKRRKIQLNLVLSGISESAKLAFYL